MSWQTKATNNVLLERALMLKNIRAFFDDKDIIEVETPLLSQFTVTDAHLDSLQADFRRQQRYLNTSPEYAMKRLIASWRRSIFQICKAFRDDTPGVVHNPEFTLLEWYRVGYDMQQLMEELSDLVKYLCELSGYQTILNPNFVFLSYQSVFENVVGINPHCVTAVDCFQLASSKNIEIPEGFSVEDDVETWLDWFLVQLVFPSFDKKSFTFLYDYPASQCALAKIEKNNQGIQVAKRFELFFGETELANGYHELTDGIEQLKRFDRENELRARLGKETVTIDKNFIAALDAGLPNCAGVAVGLDRLLMILTGSKEIEQVLSFGWESA